ncbi:MAG: ABC transporter permease [Eubacterium sp.]|nr:ABC transporter permease [Eubacterium sp.]
MRNIIAIMKKQWKDTLKNKPVLIQFIIFPIMAVIMTKLVEIPGMAPTYFIKIFAGMFVGMSPLVATSSILSEEKDQGTLRVLFMSNVKSMEYLLAIGSYVFLFSMLGAGVMCLAGGYVGSDALRFLIILAAGILTSILIGSAIGVFSKNQMVATSIMTPLMMIFAFVPMIGGFNEQVQKVSRFLYSGQIDYLIDHIGNNESMISSLLIILINAIIALVLFALSYKNLRKVSCQ